MNDDVLTVEIVAEGWDKRWRIALSFLKAAMILLLTGRVTWGGSVAQE